MSTTEQVFAVLRTLANRHGLEVERISLEMPLYAEGLGLDSLQAAELSAMLEARLGSDPYTAGEFPETVADLVSYFDRPTEISKLQG